MRSILLSLCCGLTMLVGCAPDAPPVSQQAAVQAATQLPSDERLARLYQQSCKICHGLAQSGAPLARDQSQWDPRWAKGLPALLQSTVTGLNGMPPGGQCFACTAQDYQALIAFMAGRDAPNGK